MRLAISAVLVATLACGRSPDAAPIGDSAAGVEAGGAATPEPVSLTEVAPGDTATILRVMRGTMADIDGLLPTLEQRDTTLPPVPPEEPRRLTVWLDNGTPRKLRVSEPNDVGAMTAESQYWLVGGELRVVQQPYGGFVFYGDRILVWTDGALEPVPDIPDSDRMAKELELIAEARARLAVFGLKLP